MSQDIFSLLDCLLLILILVPILVLVNLPVSCLLRIPCFVSRNKFTFGWGICYYWSVKLWKNILFILSWIFILLARIRPIFVTFLRACWYFSVALVYSILNMITAGIIFGFYAVWYRHFLLAQQRVAVVLFAWFFQVSERQILQSLSFRTVMLNWFLGGPRFIY